jgi:sortase A
MRMAPPLLITLGSVLLANVAWPILSYQLLTAPQIKKDSFTAPVAAEQLGNALPPKLARSVSLGAKPAEVLGADMDYTNARNWFPEAAFAPTNEGKTYSIDIPTLRIQNAKVVVGGEDLSHNLIHYPGTALPGQLGAPVVFGHSILRQFYSPAEDNPNRYLSIFSTIMTLSIGDKIYVDFEGVRYTYEVREKVEVKPEDVFILEQRFQNRELKLVTCVPEGTYLRRGVVIAQLVNFNE